MPVGGPIQAFCAGAILFFFPGYFTSLALLAKQSVAGRVGTAIGFSFALLAVLEVVYTTLLIHGDPLTIVGPLFLWTTLMFVFSLALKREEASIDFNSLFKLDTIVIVAMLLFGTLTRIWYPLTVGTTPYSDPLYWATRASYFVHTGFTGIPSFLAGGSGDWIRERSFEFMTGSFAMIGNASVVDTAIWFGPIAGILASIMLLAVLERLGVSLSGKVVGLFLFSSMSPLFELFWRTNITIMQVIGTYFLFLGLYLCASQEAGSFLSGAFVLGLSMDMHILYGIYTPFIFIFVVIAQPHETAEYPYRVCLRPHLRDWANALCLAVPCKRRTVQLHACSRHPQRCAVCDAIDSSSICASVGVPRSDIHPPLRNAAHRGACDRRVRRFSDRDE